MRLAGRRRLSATLCCCRTVLMRGCHHFHMVELVSVFGSMEMRCKRQHGDSIEGRLDGLAHAGTLADLRGH